MSKRVDLSKYKPLQTIRMLDGRRQLTRSMTIGVDGEFYTVPEGFPTDFSSYPTLARMIVRFDRVDVAGALHDYLYRYGLVTRAKADECWRLVAISGDHHANAAQAWVSWFGLRIGGWVQWNKYRKAERNV